MNNEIKKNEQQAEQQLNGQKPCDYYDIDKSLLENEQQIKQPVNNEQRRIFEKVNTNNNNNNNNNNNKQKQVLLEHFEKIWQEYPRKKGKAKAEEYFLKYTTTGRKINGRNVKLTDIQIWRAVCKYRDECKRNRIEQQFIKYGDTFFNKSIIDYIEAEDKTEEKEEYKEIDMTEEEYIKKMDEGGKRYV